MKHLKTEHQLCSSLTCTGDDTRRPRPYISTWNIRYIDSTCSVQVGRTLVSYPDLLHSSGLGSVGLGTILVLNGTRCPVTSLM